MRQARIEAGRRHQGAAHGLPGEDHLQHLLVLGIGHEIGDQGDGRQLPVLVERQLHDDLELAGFEQVLVAGPGDPPGIADDAVQLASFDGQQNFVGARIAADGREPGAQERVERRGEHLLVAAGAGGADLEVCARQNLRERRRRAGLPNVEPRHLVVHAAEPGEPGGVEHRVRGIAGEHRIRRHAAAHDGDLGAVPGRHVVDVVRQIERAGAGLVQTRPRSAGPEDSCPRCRASSRP